jgi:hypothetical protein
MHIQFCIGYAHLLKKHQTHEATKQRWHVGLTHLSLDYPATVGLSLVAGAIWPSIWVLLVEKDSLSAVCQLEEFSRMKLYRLSPRSSTTVFAFPH